MAVVAYCGDGVIEPVVPVEVPGVVLGVVPRAPRWARVADRVVALELDGDIALSLGDIEPVVPIVVPSPAVPGAIDPVVLPALLGTPVVEVPGPVPPGAPPVVCAVAAVASSAVAAMRYIFMRPYS